MSDIKQFNSENIYEDRWTEVFNIIENDIKKNGKSLIEAIETHQRAELLENAKNSFYFNIHKKLGITSSTKQEPKKRLVVKDGHYAIASVDTTFSSEIINSLIEIIQEDETEIDYVVELGSGIGRHIFTLADRLLPNQRHNKIEYFSCEFTDSGQDACRKLLKYSKEKNIHVKHVDYINPDLSFLPINKNYLFFTSHSIEQIPNLKKEVIIEMLKVSARCICLHAEPVGWQYNKDLIEYRSKTKPGSWKDNQSFFKKKIFKLNRNLFNKYGFCFMKIKHKYGIEIDKSDIKKPTRVSINAARHSLELNYNANLVQLLKTLETEGLIKIDSELINVYGKKPFNPTTMIKWHKTEN